MHAVNLGGLNTQMAILSWQIHDFHMEEVAAVNLVAPDIASASSSELCLGWAAHMHEMAEAMRRFIAP